MILLEERQAVVEFGKKMLLTGLVKGTGGNISLCNADKTLLAISPTGVSYIDMQPEDITVTNLEGVQVDGKLAPSSEIAFHLALVNQRPDIFAVVHTHSDYATTMACLRWELPAVHYLIGSAGLSVPVAPYATFGTQTLAENICQTIGSGNAVLLANHGLITVGPNLKKAFSTAEMVEYVSRLYITARSVGEPVILSDQEMQDVLDKFGTYGQQYNADQDQVNKKKDLSPEEIVEYVYRFYLNARSEGDSPH